MERSGTAVDERPQRKERKASGLVAPFVLAYAAAAVLLGSLVWAGGLWNLLAGTRVLDLLIRSGAVALTDMDAGFIQGVPDADFFLASQDPVDWGMVFLAILLLLGVLGIRAMRFHGLARFCGITGTLGGHTRAYLYGWSSDAFLPFGYGRAARAAALEGQGASPGRAAEVVYLARLFHAGELILFTLVGLVTLAWSTALGTAFWPLVMLGVAVYIMRRPAGERQGTTDRIREAASDIAREPSTLFRISALSIVAFLMEAIAIYAITQAFTSPNVILNVDFTVILMALVAGYVARFVTITPGGFGQFEWGLAVAIYISGTGIPEAVIIAILYAIVRYVVSGAVLGIMTFTTGAEAGTEQVLPKMAVRS